MPAKKRTTKDIIAQDFPGWKVVDQSALPKKKKSVKGLVDTATPPLDEIVSTFSDVASFHDTTGRRGTKKKPVKHAKFVTIAPANQSDSAAHQQKVVLIRNGKVVAEQG